MKRTLALLLALMTVIGLLAGCAKEPTSGTTGSETPSGSGTTSGASGNAISEILYNCLSWFGSMDSTFPVFAVTIPRIENAVATRQRMMMKTPIFFTLLRLFFLISE